MRRTAEPVAVPSIPQTIEILVKQENCNRLQHGMGPQLPQHQRATAPLGILATLARVGLAAISSRRTAHSRGASIQIFTRFPEM